LIKLAEYEKLAIPEYWIVDYLGLGGRRYIGNPKQPTICVNQLVDGEYSEPKSFVNFLLPPLSKGRAGVG
jgi:Uma2 family endonuclease